MFFNAHVESLLPTLQQLSLLELLAGQLWPDRPNGVSVWHRRLGDKKQCASGSNTQFFQTSE